MTATYVYSPLSRGSIRLLRFTHNTPTDNHYELASFPLREAPRYNALSYCWGDPDRSRSIQCNSKTMMITPVLHGAMQYLNALDRGTTAWIWIDQICINQADKVERAVQVDMMKDIYESSQGTIIWLGPDIPGIEAVPSLVERLSHLHKEDINPGGTRRRSRYTMDEYTAAGLPSTQDPAWEALGDVLSRPWFVRSWVIQEAVLSNTPPRIICGSYELSWETLVPAATWLLSMCYRLTPLSLKQTTLPALRSLKLFSELGHLGLPWDLTTLLNKAIRFNASEPRDRVYSLLALTGEVQDTWTSSPRIQANYERPVERIFRDVTRYIIMSTGTLRVWSLLRYVPDWNRSLSWVVDFTAAAEWERLSYFDWAPRAESCHCLREIFNDAAGGRPAVVLQNTRSDDVLALQGLQIDTVDATCQVMLKSELTSFDPLIWAAWRTACQRIGTKYPTPEAISRAFMVTLTADWNLSDNERMSDQPLTHFWSYMWRVYHGLCDGRAVGEAEDEYTKYLMTLKSDSDGKLFSRHLDAAHNRRLFFTKNRAYIGLGPRMMQKDDVLCVLFGGATPMVLRPFGGYHRFVGECYVFDLMNGEAIRDWDDGKHSMQTFHLL
ncbi:hypothetical protein ACJZ2D_006616 [Fusarium nematophilum]